MKFGLAQVFRSLSYFLVVASSLSLNSPHAVSNSSVSEGPLKEEQYNRDYCREDPVVEAEQSYEEYRIKITSAGDHTCRMVDIEHRGLSVFHEEEIGDYYFLGYEDEGGEAFVNLTGGEKPNLVFSKWTGGAHCCYSVRIFSLDKEFHEVANLYGGNFAPEFYDIDGDRVPEIFITDDFLAYRFSSFAYSATAQVILKFSSGRYRVAAEYMKRPAPDLAVFGKKIEKWQRRLRRVNEAEWPPPSMIQAVTDLVFSGHKPKVFELIDRAWPLDVPGKTEFLKEYEQALQESLYYSEFERQL